MATYGERTKYHPETDKLQNLKFQLEDATKAVTQLQSAIAFLEANPGAVALVNSI